MKDEAFIREVCRRELGVEPSGIHRLGSLTNTVYHLDFKERKPLIFKVINHKNPNLFLFRSKDAESLLTSVGFLKDILLCKGEGFRIENFIPSKSLTTEDLRSHAVRLLLTRPIAHFHNLLPPRGKDDALILDLWRSVFPDIRAKIQANFVGSEMEEKVGLMVAEMDDWVRNTLATHPFFGHTVFSHNDLLGGNLLFNTETERYVLIDFEYGGFSPMESDLFNLLVESIYDYGDTHPSGFDPDPASFPTDTQLRELIHFYLFFRRNPGVHPDLPDKEASLEAFRKHPGFAAVPSEDIERFFKVIFLVGNVQNVLWSLWSLYMCKREGVAFDYVSFAFIRFQDFRRFKERFEQVNFGGM